MTAPFHGADHDKDCGDREKDPSSASKDRKHYGANRTPPAS